MKNTISLFLLLIATQAEAIPTFAKLLELNNSIVVVNVDFPDGSSGTGTGVVVSKEYVATDCHVIANTLGANISKYDDTYRREDDAKVILVKQEDKKGELYEPNF